MLRGRCCPSSSALVPRRSMSPTSRNGHACDLQHWDARVSVKVECQFVRGPMIQSSSFDDPTVYDFTLERAILCARERQAQACHQPTAPPLQVTIDTTMTGHASSEEDHMVSDSSVPNDGAKAFPPPFSHHHHQDPLENEESSNDDDNTMDVEETAPPGTPPSRPHHPSNNGFMFVGTRPSTSESSPFTAAKPFGLGRPSTASPFFSSITKANQSPWANVLTASRVKQALFSSPGRSEPFGGLDKSPFRKALPVFSSPHFPSKQRAEQQAGPSGPNQLFQPPLQQGHQYTPHQQQSQRTPQQQQQQSQSTPQQQQSQSTPHQQQPQSTPHQQQPQSTPREQQPQSTLHQQQPQHSQLSQNTPHRQPPETTPTNSRSTKSTTYPNPPSQTTDSPPRNTSPQLKPEAKPKSPSTELPRRLSARYTKIKLLLERHLQLKLKAGDKPKATASGSQAGDKCVSSATHSKNATPMVEPDRTSNGPTSRKSGGARASETKEHAPPASKRAKTRTKRPRNKARRRKKRLFGNKKWFRQPTITGKELYVGMDSPNVRFGVQVVETSSQGTPSKKPAPSPRSTTTNEGAHPKSPTSRINHHHVSSPRDASPSAESKPNPSEHHETIAKLQEELSTTRDMNSQMKNDMVQMKNTLLLLEQKFNSNLNHQHTIAELQQSMELLKQNIDHVTEEHGKSSLEAVTLRKNLEALKMNLNYMKSERDRAQQRAEFLEKDAVETKSEVHRLRREAEIMGQHVSGAENQAFRLQKKLQTELVYRTKMQADSLVIRDQIAKVVTETDSWNEVICNKVKNLDDKLKLVEKKRAILQRIFSKQRHAVEEAKEQAQCVICFENCIDIVFVPCGHRSVCSGCGSRVSRCPVCRQPIQLQVKTYDS